VQDRVATVIRVDEQARHSTEEEVEELQAASRRLDKLLAKIAEDEDARRKEIREEEIRQLQAASGRLDKLLAGAGEGMVIELKRRRRKRDTTE
jgi:hypothetical protein